MQLTITFDLDATRETMSGDFMTAHHPSWKDDENPTDLELKNSISKFKKLFLFLSNTSAEESISSFKINFDEKMERFRSKYKGYPLCFLSKFHQKIEDFGRF